MAGSAGSIEYTPRDRLVRDFVSRGLVVLAPESLGVPAELHAQIYAREREAFGAKERISAARIPEILDVINSPGVVASCNELVGENWAVVPFTHNTPFVSGSHDQHWHKDDNGPYNMRKARHHHAVQVEMLYYPQEVCADMGPTATIPYSQYWTFNHEENHDNFAGADHLDFAYQLNGMERLPVSGPRSSYGDEDVRNARTDHDKRMHEAVDRTGWPLVKPFEAGPLRAGSVILYSHNLFHRGNHRRDDWRTWKANPRFMWRFWLYRTTDPESVSAENVLWREPDVDPLTGVELGRLDEDVTAVWRCQHHWLRTGRSVATPPTASGPSAELAARLWEAGDAAEPRRIGAAYRLAELGEAALDELERALHDERESVRRAATYGLVAMGEAAKPVFLRACDSAVKWVRRAGAFGLGAAAPLDREVLTALTARLAEDPSVYVRSVAADGIGCLARRGIARAQDVALVEDCCAALVGALEVEQNRLAMNVAQERSIKFVRPTDECDVCEGMGIDYGVERFERVRSAVRESALWSLVMICTHGELVGDARERVAATLEKIIHKDTNVFSVGLAMDALNRLAPERLDVGDSPLQDWESLSRSRLAPAAALARDALARD